jgi:(2Fe-2S) ferredoxin
MGLHLPPAQPGDRSVNDAVPAPETMTEPEADPPPYYRAHVFVCCNRRPDGHRRGSCAAKGSEALRDYMKARAKELGLKGVRVNSAGCLDRCEFGPTVVIYPEGVWYSPKTREDVDAILAGHLVRGGRVRRLMLTEKDVPPAKD